MGEMLLLVGIAKADRALVGVGEDDWTPDTTRRVHVGIAKADRGATGRDACIGHASLSTTAVLVFGKDDKLYSSSPTTIRTSRHRRNRLDSIFEKK